MWRKKDRLWWRTFAMLMFLPGLIAIATVRGHPEVWLIIGAGFCNMLAIYANGKKMPARGRPEITERHCPFTKETRLKFLCDIIPVGIGMASVGDVLLLIGSVLYFSRS
jgi:hypothetical protein